MAYNILILGASYGSLLASKMMFAGHNVTLVCLPAEAELINAEGFRVRMPVRGRKEPVEIDSRKLPGKVRAGGPGGVQPIRFRPDRPRHAGAAIPFGRRARAAGRGSEVARANHVDHEHAAAPLYAAHPRPQCRCAAFRLYRPQRLGQLRSRHHDAVQPRSAGRAPARGAGQRAAGDAPNQLQGRPLRQRSLDRHSQKARGRHSGGALSG